MKNFILLSLVAISLQSTGTYAGSGSGLGKASPQATLAGLGNPPASDKAGAGQESRVKEVDKTIVEISVSGTVFAIPKHYVSPMSKTDFISIRLVLPSLRSANEVRATSPEEITRSDQSILVMIVNRGIGDIDTVLNNDLRQGFVVPGQRYPNLQLEEFFSPIKGAWLYYRSLDKNMKTPSGKPFSITCRPPNGVLDETNDCEVAYTVFPAVSVRYYYRTSQLRHWKKIDNAVRELVMSFAKGKK